MGPVDDMGNDFWETIEGLNTRERGYDLLAHSKQRDVRCETQWTRMRRVKWVR